VTFDRRRFLGFAAGAAAGAALGGSAGRVLTDLLHSEDTAVYPPKGPETFTLSVCAMCPGGCGIRVRKISERAVKVEGNPLHPVNGGRLCPRGHAALQSLYHPDRIPGPLRRVGPRGSISSFERVSWDRALGEIGGRLRKLREVGRPESLALVRSSRGGIATRGARRFLEAFGSPNDVVLDRGEEGAALALALTQGVRAVPAYDLAAADFVLCVGGAYLEASGSPVHAMRAYGRFRQGRIGRRGKFIQVEPRLSITGSSADEWIAVKAGTEGLFALGVAGVLVSEGLYNRDFILERTSGFEDSAGKPGFRSLLAKHYGLETVSSETGVPVDVILRVAREFAAARRSLAIGPRRGPLLSGRPFDHLAVQALNALAGNVDAPGGLLVPEDVPLAPWPELARDPTGERGRRRPRLDGASNDPTRVRSDPEQLAEAILTERPYRAEALLILGADPLFASAAPERFAAALERVPLTVSFASLPDDTALACDWILPEAHFLERWELWTTPPGIPYPLASLAQPALARPLRDARPAAEVLLALAAQIGPVLEQAFPAKNVPGLLRFEMDGLDRARRGAVMGTPFDEAWVRMMEGAGWWAPGYRSAEELWNAALKSGGWWDPFYDHEDWKRVLRTDSGRYEFRSERLEPRTTPVEPAPAFSPSASRPASTREPSKRALALHLFEPLAIAGGTGAELPFLMGILDPGHAAGWETWAEIHPEMGALLGVRDGEAVQLRSRDSAITARARLTPRVVPGTVAIPVGLGKRGGGRWAAGVGANPLRLLSPTRDPVCGLLDFEGTTVEVSAAPAGGREKRA
jgi:anaerobic selenocysteine-containing dehydrogenase